MRGLGAPHQLEGKRELGWRAGGAIRSPRIAGVGTRSSTRWAQTRAGARQRPLPSLGISVIGTVGTVLLLAAGTS
jgi:hypothetical protein